MSVLLAISRRCRDAAYWGAHGVVIAAAGGRKRGDSLRDGALVVKPDNIGDFILFTSIIDSISKFASGRPMALVCSGQVAGLLPMLPAVFDRVIAVDKKRYRRSPLYRMRTLTAVAELDSVCALHPVFSRDAIGDEAALCTGIPTRIAFAGSSRLMPRASLERNNRLYTRLIEANDGGHEIERYWQFADALGGNPPARKWPKLTPPPLAGNLRRQLDTIGPFYCVAPGAASSYRCWPATKYAEALRRIHTDWGIRPVLCGDAADHPLVKVIASLLPGLTLSLCGQTTLLELASVMAASRFFIGSESGPLHLAAAVGKPTVGILGGGHFGMFYPWRDGGRRETAARQMDCFGCNWQCRYGRPRCVEAVSVDDVMACVQRALAKDS